MKRARPELIIFSYQGDGDLASIGMAEIIHAAGRSENISVFFINNANYGMTDGQMAPTTLLNQKTANTPYGRKSEYEGYPIKVCELLASLQGPVYLERTAVYDPKTIRVTKNAIHKSFRLQMENKGFSLE